MILNYKHIHDTPILLQDNRINPGQSAVCTLKVGQLPSGSLLTLAAHVYRSQNPGPTVLLLGGVHGDEINGIQIINSILESKVLNSIKIGSIIAIPLLNVFGFNNLSRDLPDGKDVNRSFPGSTGGSLASRVARTITKYVLPYIDVAIDLHTGGADRYNYPQTRFTKSDPTSKELALLFGAPYAIQNALIVGSFRKAARDLGCHAIVYEGGESVRINKLAIEHGMLGIMRVLVGLDMIASSNATPITSPTIIIEKTDWIRASKPGIFMWQKKSGEEIKAGETIGTIKDPYGFNSYNVVSKEKGYLIGHNNAAVVNIGDPLFHLGKL